LKVAAGAILALVALSLGPQGAEAQRRSVGSSHYDLVSIRSTAPRISDCAGTTHRGCFRMFLEIVATTDTPVSLAYPHVAAFGGQIASSQAYLGSGITCDPEVLSGLGRRYEPWVSATRTRPVRVVIQFYCDQPVRRGDTAFIDLSFYVQPEGSERRLERFPFPERTIE
jgi:hypothetical protein